VSRRCIYQHRIKAVSTGKIFCSPTPFIQTGFLRFCWVSEPLGVPLPIKRTPLTDKVSRLYGVSSMIESGQLVIPREAPWLAVFLKELLGFPNTKHDDQVDALTQLLEWVRIHLRPVNVGAAPEILSVPERNWNYDYHRDLEDQDDEDWDA
jgi:hypothetical protein